MLPSTITSTSPKRHRDHHALLAHPRSATKGFPPPFLPVPPIINCQLAENDNPLVRFFWASFSPIHKCGVLPMRMCLNPPSLTWQFHNNRLYSKKKKHGAESSGRMTASSSVNREVLRQEHSSSPLPHPYTWKEKRGPRALYHTVRRSRLITPASARSPSCSRSYCLLAYRTIDWSLIWSRTMHGEEDRKNTQTHIRWR
jgi:hypothetical protein